MIYILFLLAHFIGDFILQTTWIVQWKHRSWHGLIFHTSLVSLSFIVVLFPYLSDWRVGVAVAINFVLHSLQDQWKIRTAYRWREPLTPYLIDQLLHISLALILAFWVSDAQPTLDMASPLAEFYTNPLLLVFCLGVVLMSYASDITLYVIQLTHHGSFEYQRNYQGMLIRVAVFSVIFAGLYRLTS